MNFVHMHVLRSVVSGVVSGKNTDRAKQTPKQKSD